MADPEQPQIYLITPPTFDLLIFPDLLGGCLDKVDVGCVRLALASQDEDMIARAADACREVCHARDVALVIDSHLQMVARLGLDGVHLTDGARSVRHTRKELGEEAIVGAFCAGSRHEGITAGEGGADYVSFGPVGKTSLGDGTQAGSEIFEWWTNMIEVPVVAEGALDEGLLRKLAPHVDFVALGDEVWSDSDDPVGRLATLATWLRD